MHNGETRNYGVYYQLDYANGVATYEMCVLLLIESMILEYRRLVGRE